MDSNFKVSREQENVVKISEKWKPYFTLRCIAKSHIQTRDGSLHRYGMEEYSTLQDQNESLITGHETIHFPLNREP